MPGDLSTPQKRDTQARVALIRRKGNNGVQRTVGNQGLDPGHRLAPIRAGHTRRSWEQADGNGMMDFVILTPADRSMPPHLASHDEDGLSAGQPRPQDAAKQNLAPQEPVVLLVEDNHINQVVALEFLALMGLQTRLAKNGLEALAACAEQAPDLVLMDIQMPGMDGLECARRLRALQSTGELPAFPILALTAHALDSDVKASMDAGMDEHLTKPLDFAALRTRLGRWLKLPGQN